MKSCDYSDGFFDKVQRRSFNSLLCVGLDPRSKTAKEALQECIKLIDATSDFTAVYKPNAAFFEAFGASGWDALAKVISYAEVTKCVPTILDAKRGDIASTADAYAASSFDVLKAGAITVSPYMGVDSLKPFTKSRQYGVFVLCKTSNPGSNELQTLPIGNSDDMLYERVAKLAETKWNANGNIGLVVGATDPTAISRARAAAPSLWFLVPGIGAQGGDLAKSLRCGLRRDGSGMLINVSRGISEAKDPRAAAKALCEEIEKIRSSIASEGSDTIATALIRCECARFGSFTLKTGIVSPIYIDLRRLITYPDVLRLVAKEFALILQNIEFDRIVGLPYAALPIATAIGLEMSRPVIYPRSETKTYGTKAAIEGVYNKGERVVIIDDLVTTGETKFEAIEKMKAAGLNVVSIVVLIDREMGATELFGKAGYNFRAVTNLSQLLSAWRSGKLITQAQYNDVLKFMGKTSKL